MYRKLIKWCRKHKMYSALEVARRAEHALRFRLSEKMLDHWYESVGKTLPEVKSEMRLWHYRADWNKFSVEDKRSIYAIVMYY